MRKNRNKKILFLQHVKTPKISGINLESKFLLIKQKVLNFVTKFKIKLLRSVSLQSRHKVSINDSFCYKRNIKSNRINEN